MAPEYALGQLRPKNRVVPVVQPLRYRVRALAWAAARPGTIRNARSRHKLTLSKSTVDLAARPPPAPSTFVGGKSEL